MSDKYPGGFVTANAPAGFSVAFNGSSDTLSIPSNAAFAFGTGDFTVETWAYRTSAPAQGSIIGVGYGVGGFGVFIASNGDIGVTRPGTAVDFTFSANVPTNQWVHIAITRSGTSLRCFLNGTQVGTTQTSSTNYAQGILYIGVDSNGSSQYYAGYFSNLRILKGTALYTTTFTPPTQLFPVTNTSLLTCQSPTIIDNSTNNFAITVSGNAVVSNFTPFAAYQGFNPALGAAAGGVWTLDEAAYYQNNRQWPIYDPYFNNTTLMLHGNGTNGAQNNTFLDSSTNNFTITRNGNTTQGSFSPFSQTGWSYNGTAGAYCTLNNADYSLGTGDFTVETWMYCVDDSTYSYANICSAPSNPNFTVGFGAGGGSGARQLYVEYGGSATGIGNNMSGYLNRWTHIAVVRQSGTVTAYQNGVSLGSISKSASVGSTANLYLLRNTGDTGMDFRGYISNYRITKSAVYTSNFTPSTAPLTAVTSTVLLTFQDNRFVDNSANNSTVTPAGTASVQAFSPFVPAYITPATYSNWFDGSGDYLTVSNNAAFDLGSGDATIEAWIYPTSSSQTCGIFDKRSSGANYSQFPQIALSSGAIVVLISYSGSSWAVTINGATPAAYTWSHIALVRNGNTWTLYVNGVVSGTPVTASGSVYSSTDSLSICASTSGGLNPFTGCISNARIVKGTAVYTAAFTPPTAPLINITNTSLLTCQSSTFIDNSSNNFTITANGNVQPVTSPTPFPAKVDTTTLNSAYSTSLIGGSGYFDGTGDYLSVAYNVALSSGTGDFTTEFWVYHTVAAGSTNMYCSIGQSSGIAIYRTSGGKIQVDQDAVANLLTSTNNVPVNAWTHIALTRSGTSLRLFMNGAQEASATNSTNFNGTGVTTLMSNNGSNLNTGYMCGFRYLKGSAVYTSNFAPPVAPLTAITNTQLLLNYTNAGIIDNTAKNVFETVGNAQISTTQSKWGGSSMYFDGTGDYLQAPNSKISNFGGGDFTIEFWMYASSQALAPIVHQTSYSSTQGWIVWNYDGSNVSASTRKLTLMLNATFVLTTSADAYSDNTWTHIAVVKSGTGTNNIKIYSNGVVAATGTYATAVADATTPLMVGGIISGVSWNGTSYFNGYIDDLRITRAARYTTNFTPPTSQLQDQ